MTPIGAAGNSPINTFSVLKDAKARVSAKRGDAPGQSAAPTLADLAIPRTNSFAQKIESDGLPTTVLYDAFGRFRKAILPKGQVVDIYM